MHDDPDQAEGFWNRWRDLRQCRRELYHGGSIERSTTHRKLVCKFLSHRHAARRKYFKQSRVRQSPQRQTPLQRRVVLTPIVSLRAESRNLSLLKPVVRDVSTSLDMTKQGR